MRYIALTSAVDGRPRKKVSVDEFIYTVSTPGGESSVTLPDGRTFDSSDFLNVFSNGLKMDIDVEYEINDSTSINAKTCAMYSDGKFPYGCVLSFELYTM